MIPPRQVVTFAAVCLAAAMVTGCSATDVSTVNTPPLTAGSRQMPVPPTSQSAAPSVADPVQVAGKLKADPCGLLTDGQVHSLGVPDDDGGNRRAQASLATQCAWSNGGAQTTVSVAWELANDGGLKDIYAQRAEMGYFIPVTVRGFPGVLGTPADTRSYGDCSLHIGVNSRDLLLVQYTKDGGPWRASCAKVKRAASAALETLTLGAQ